MFLFVKSSALERYESFFNECLHFVPIEFGKFSSYIWEYYFVVSHRDRIKNIEFVNKKKTLERKELDIMMLFLSCKKTGAARKLEQA